MKLGFVFPGQGSQSVGMLADLAHAYPLVQKTFEVASDVLGYDLWRLSQEGPADELNRTDRTQPAVLAAGVAAWRVWADRGGTGPALMAGHSLGEYTALVCANALTFDQAISLVAERGRLMQEAVLEGEGAMAAILGLEDAQVIGICQDAAGGQVVSAANFNSPGQVVVAGAKAAVERTVAAAKSVGARRAVVLPVSVPSHCELMRPAAERFSERLEQTEFSAPDVPVLHNVDATAHDDPETIRKVLTEQLFSPVRWVETIRKMASEEVDTVIEGGPGKMLVGLNRRIEKGMNAMPVFDPESLDKALAGSKE